MEQLTVKELYNLEETIAKDIFEDATYPWEVLPKIGAFIVELGKTYGLQNLPRLHRQHTLTDLQLSEKMQKSDTAHLSVGMLL